MKLHKLRAKMAEQGLTVAKMAEVIGIDHSTL